MEEEGEKKEKEEEEEANLKLWRRKFLIPFKR